MDFKGVVLFSSHDHEFVQTIANRIMVLEDGKLTDRLGTYEDISPRWQMLLNDPTRGLPFAQSLCFYAESMIK